MAASTLFLPIAASCCQTISRLVASELHHRLGNEALPQITQFWIVGQAYSSAGLGIAIAISLLLAVAAIKVSRLSEANPWKATSQILVTILGPTLAFLMLGSTLMGAMLPFVITIQAAPK